MYTLTQLHSEDLNAIIAFDQLCFPVDFWKEEDWKSLLSDKRATYYALLHHDTLIADVFIYNWQGENDYVKIMNIAVHPQYRKQGLAHQLLGHVSEEMAKAGMKRFCGETRSSNTEMHSVFEGCGYRLNRVEEYYYHHPDESAYKYVLQL